MDFGGGLARIAAASIDSPDVYRISLLWPIVARLEEITGLRYADRTVAMRVVADHLRGATFLAVDGVVPSNKAQGYVMRRLVRRAVRFAFDLGLEDNFFPTLVPVVAGIYVRDYPEVEEGLDRVIAVLVKEETAFRRTLRKGLRQLEKYPAAVGGAELFRLYDTYGFPVERSTEEARQRGMSLSPSWRSEFDARMAEQRARSQRAGMMAP